MVAIKLYFLIYEVYCMDNSQMVTFMLKEKGAYPEIDVMTKEGLCLRMQDNQLLLQGTPTDLIDLADLLVALATAEKAEGQHWHIDDLTLMDEESEIPELVLLRK